MSNLKEIEILDGPYSSSRMLIHSIKTDKGVLPSRVIKPEFYISKEKFEIESTSVTYGGVTYYELIKIKNLNPIEIGELLLGKEDLDSILIKDNNKLYILTK